MKTDRVSLIEVLTALAIMVVAGAFLWGLIMTGPPSDYRYDPLTGTITWTDHEGRRLMKSPDGSVRELSR